MVFFLVVEHMFRTQNFLFRCLNSLLLYVLINQYVIFIFPRFVQAEFVFSIAVTPIFCNLYQAGLSGLQMSPQLNLDDINGAWFVALSSPNDPHAQASVQILDCPRAVGQPINVVLQTNLKFQNFTHNWNSTYSTIKLMIRCLYK